MKKQYIKPEAFAYDIELTNMLATSPLIDDSFTVEEGGELGREDNNSHITAPNLWEQGW